MLVSSREHAELALLHKDKVAEQKTERTGEAAHAVTKVSLTGPPGLTSTGISVSAMVRGPRIGRMLPP